MVDWKVLNVRRERPGQRRGSGVDLVGQLVFEMKGDRQGNSCGEGLGLSPGGQMRDIRRYRWFLSRQ